ncbi:MAG: hypothetical protein JSU04_08215 [Bdellovibrionales bacterium]|nr:hypothetical protein [Bdellovibrionales bacterium]
MENQASKIPAEIRKAILMIIGSIALGVVRFALTYEQTKAKVEAANIPGMAPWIFIIFTLIFSFGFNLVLLFFLSRRKNWARIVFTILFVIGVPMSLPYLMEAFNVAPVSGVVGAFQLALQLYGVILLYQTPSNVWFKKPQAPTDPTAT